MRPEMPTFATRVRPDLNETFSPLAFLSAKVPSPETELDDAAFADAERQGRARHFSQRSDWVGRLESGRVGVRSA